jgi:glycerophosphoryl diester phosphodiesterase
VSRGAGSDRIGRRDDGSPLVVVHGGAEALRYRNVLEALDAALTHRADYFEFDVRRTADAALVVHHDEDIEGVLLRSLTCAEAQRAAAAAGYELPRLETILTRARGALRLDVELKEAGYEHVVIQAVRASGFDPTEFVVTSFEQTALDAVHATDSDIVTGFLVYEVTGAEALALFRRSGAAFLGPDHAMLDDQTLREAARMNIRLLPWTANAPDPIGRLMQAEAVVGVITDRPDVARDVRDALASRAGRNS